MRLLYGGAAVIDEVELVHSEGVRRYRVPISRAMGARDIAQTVSVYGRGKAPARRNPSSEEVLYVVRGRGGGYIEGHRYQLAPGTALYIPPASVYQIENSGTEEELEVVAVCCPESDNSETGVAVVERDPSDTAPLLIVREAGQKSIAAGDRAFKLLCNQETGCVRVTQFIGVIPPGRSPMHHHTYEEAIYILEGEGTVHTESGSEPFRAGTSIYLPRGVSHCLENTGTANIRLLGVFHPSESPATRYDD